MAGSADLRGALGVLRGRTEADAALVVGPPAPETVDASVGAVVATAGSTELALAAGRRLAVRPAGATGSRAVRHASEAIRVAGKVWRVRMSWCPVIVAGAEIGAVAVVRRAAGPALSRRATRVLLQAAGSEAVVARALVDAMPPLQTKDGYLVLDVAGRLQASSPAAGEWLDGRRMAALQGVVSRLDVSAGNEPAAGVRIWLDGLVARVVTMRGGDRPLTMVHLRRCEAPSTAAFEGLSPALTRVAVLAANGLTVKAIGADLGKSANTVKTQLRQIYRVLGVSNRAELARLLSDQPG